MTHKISEKTQDILNAVISLNAQILHNDNILNLEISPVSKNYKFSNLGVNFYTICTANEYRDFITDLSHYAGKNYYERYLNSTRTLLEPKIKDAEFEHGEELRLEHAKDLVVYMADCTAYEGFCIVLIDNTPERVNNLYLSRPETVEQKAAKERAKAIIEMGSVLYVKSFDATDKVVADYCCEKLYDSGYRK